MAIASPFNVVCEKRSRFMNETLECARRALCAGPCEFIWYRQELKQTDLVFIQELIGAYAKCSDDNCTRAGVFTNNVVRNFFGIITPMRMSGYTPAYGMAVFCENSFRGLMRDIFCACTMSGYCHVMASDVARDVMEGIIRTAQCELNSFYSLQGSLRSESARL